jgi:hypothetical protein
LDWTTQSGSAPRGRVSIAWCLCLGLPSFEQRVSRALNGASVTGTPFQFGGDCVLSGYLIDKR